MKLFDEINDLKHCYLAALVEPGDNALRLILEEARADDPAATHGNDGTELPFSAKAIEATPGCARFELFFNSYIAFSVRDESYAQYADIDVYEGRFAQVYSQSLFLEFVARGTFASSTHPGPFFHYGFSTLNHLVDVVSCVSPRIHRSTVTEPRGQNRRD